MVRLQTQRFGLIERKDEALLHFPGGIYGFELSRRWLLLGDQEHGSLYWLQSVDEPELSFSAVDPREFVSGYELVARRAQLEQLWVATEPLIMLSVLSQIGDRLSLNLRNPILINPSLRIGRQIVASGSQPIHYELPSHTLPVKQSA